MQNDLNGLPKTITLNIIGLQCPKCNTFIFSRTNHDYVTCECEEIFIDGGLMIEEDKDNFNCVRCPPKPDFTKLEVTVLADSKEEAIKKLKKEMYDDWNYNGNCNKRIRENVK